jgi:hypothetical protein
MVFMQSCVRITFCMLGFRNEFLQNVLGLHLVAYSGSK